MQRSDAWQLFVFKTSMNRNKKTSFSNSLCCSCFVLFCFSLWDSFQTFTVFGRLNNVNWKYILHPVKSSSLDLMRRFFFFYDCSQAWHFYYTIENVLMSEWLVILSNPLRKPYAQTCDCLTSKESANVLQDLVKYSLSNAKNNKLRIDEETSLLFFCYRFHHM